MNESVRYNDVPGPSRENTVRLVDRRTNEAVVEFETDATSTQVFRWAVRVQLAKALETFGLDAADYELAIEEKLNGKRIGQAVHPLPVRE